MNGRGEVPEGPNAMTRQEARVRDGFCESKNHLSCGVELPKRPQSASWFCGVEGAAVVSVSRSKDVLLMSGRIRRQPEKQKKQKTTRKQDARRGFSTPGTHSTGGETWRTESCRVGGVVGGAADG